MNKRIQRPGVRAGYDQWYWSDIERSRRGRLDLVAARRLTVRDAVADFQAGGDHIADALADAYGVMRDQLVQPFPGALETLSELRRRGVHMALVTNGAEVDQRRKVERFHLQPFFEAIFIEGELGWGRQQRAKRLHSQEGKWSRSYGPETEARQRNRC
jgi:putative hydrolase of the HAD superfamily